MLMKWAGGRGCIKLHRFLLLLAIALGLVSNHQIGVCSFDRPGILDTTTLTDFDLHGSLLHRLVIIELQLPQDGRCDSFHAMLAGLAGLLCFPSGLSLLDLRTNVFQSLLRMILHSGQFFVRGCVYHSTASNLGDEVNAFLGKLAFVRVLADVGSACDQKVHQSSSVQTDIWI